MGLAEGRKDGGLGGGGGRFLAQSTKHSGNKFLSFLTDLSSDV